MKSRSGVLLSAVAASIVTALIVGSVAWATIPDADNVIHGCYAKKDGVLRVIDSASSDCNTSKETALTWSQTGPKGDPGDQGLTGPSGTSHAYNASDLSDNQFVLGSNQITTLLALDLPTGRYEAFAKLDALSVPANAFVSCQVFYRFGNSSNVADAAVVSGSGAGQSLQLAMMGLVHLQLGSPGTVQLNCTSTPAGVVVRFPQLIAVAVDNVN